MLTLNEARAYCFAVDIKLALKNGGVVVSDPGEHMTDWLRDALSMHKAELIEILQFRDKYEWLTARMTDLRYIQSLPKMDREQSLNFIGDRIEMFSAECFQKFQSYNGYEDFADPYADEAVCDLRRNFAELTHAVQGYPIPVNSGIPRNCRGWRLDNDWHPRIAMKPDGMTKLWAGVTGGDPNNLLRKPGELRRAAV